MRALNILIIALCAVLWLGISYAQPANTDPRQWLLGQIRLGEALFRDDMIHDSLARLYQISPNDPLGLEAEIRLAIRHNDLQGAQRLLDQLQRSAPDSEAYRRARLLLALQEPKGHQALQHARLLASAGRLDEASAEYDKLLNHTFPTPELALEYWKLQSRLPKGSAPALAALLKLDQEYPGNIPIRQTLVNLLFVADRDEEALSMLHALATEPAARNAAAQREFDYLSAQPPNLLTAGRWEKFMSLYSGTPVYKQAGQSQAALQTLLGNPAWQAGQRGLALLEQGKNTQAEAELKLGLEAYPNDAALLGGLGMAYMRTKQRAQALVYFKQARDKESDAYRSEKWADLIASTNYWLTLDRADTAAKSRNWRLAENLYRQAYEQDKSNIEAILGLGDVAWGKGNSAQAEQYYQQARRMEPANTEALRGLLRIYEKESPQKAIAFLDTLPAKSLRPFLALRTRLELDQLKTQADKAAADRQPALAASLLARAQKLAPDDIWLSYHLAQAYQDQGQSVFADKTFEQLLQRQGQNPVARYAHALFLSSRKQDEQALATLHALPEAAWNADMHTLALRLELDRQLAYADSLRAAGNEDKAIAVLNQHPANDAIDSRLADWAEQRQDYAQAHAAYARMLARDPANTSARLGQIEIWIDEGKIKQARHALKTRPPAIEPADTNNRRRLANAWAAVGDVEQARTIMNHLVATQQTPDALLMRDAARLARRNDPQRALNLYARAMQDNGLMPATAASGRDDSSLTYATRASDSDDWLRRSLRNDVETLYRQQNPTVHLHNEFWGRNDGTPGLSNLTANTTILQADLPYKGGQAFFRTEHVIMDAGRFDTRADNSYDESFGTCALQACTSGQSQHAQGTGLALGWHNDRIAADIGVTPLGFKVVDPVGGITYKGDLKSLGWSVTLSRRAMSNSLLSYAGATDPNTGITWGGVRATGINLGLSWDRGGPNGVWANLGYHHLTGKNVESNDRFRLMAGYYRRLIDTSSKQLTIGVNTMLWHYAKDLSGYTLGQGGYYSPQHYFSLSLPIQYAWRNDTWSYRLNGSVSWSRAQTSASPDYPIQSLIPGPIGGAGINDSSTSGSSSGFGYTLGGQIERRVSSHVVIGAAVDIQRANDYNPSRAMLYLRYSFEPWHGNLPLPAQTLIPYADF